MDCISAYGLMCPTSCAVTVTPPTNNIAKTAINFRFFIYIILIIRFLTIIFLRIGLLFFVWEKKTLSGWRKSWNCFYLFGVNCFLCYYFLRIWVVLLLRHWD